MKTTCFECGDPATVKHHVIPKSKGGTKTVPLCNKCHSAVHDSNLITSAELIALGKMRSKATNAWKKVVALFESGIAKTTIAKKLNLSRNAVYYILEQRGLHINQGKGCEIKVTPDTLDRIKELRDAGKPWREVEDELNICHTHLYRIIKEYGLSDNKYHDTSRTRTGYITLTSEKIEEAKSLRALKKTWEEIAAILGVDRITLYRHGIPQQFTSLRGQLTPKKKAKAIRLKKEGMTWKEVAEELGVSVSAIFMSKTHRLLR